MKIFVTNHAIQRYRERLFNFSATDAEISDILKHIAQNGKLICQKPGTLPNCFEIKHRGISIVIIIEGKQTYIITCLGEASYRKWVKTKNEPVRISRRVCYERSHQCI